MAAHRVLSFRWLAVFLFWVPFAFSIDSSIKAAEPLQFHAQMGLGGMWKVGYPARLLLNIDAKEAFAGKIEIQTYDGDGVPVVYENESWRLNLDPNQKSQVELCVKNGRGNRPIVVRFIDTQNRTVAERALDADERGTAIPATQPWVVGIGSQELKLDQAVMKSARGALSEYSIVQLTRPEELPIHANCYEGVDLLVWSSRNTELNQAYQADQLDAISQWLRTGGRCALSLGANAESWMNHPKLAAIVPGQFKGIAQGADPAPMESFLRSQSQLDNLQCAMISLDAGTIELTTQTNNRIKLPLIARWVYGAGKVTLIATELDGPQMLAWESRPSLLKWIYTDQWEGKDSKVEKSMYQGYDDLSGQLHATLDYFPDLTLGDLTSISMIAGIFCLIVGPLDYFLISRMLRRPRATWLTLLICSLGSCMFISGLTKSWKPELPSLNSLELMDIDYQNQTLFGHAYAHCYGGQRGAFDIAAQRRPTTDATPRATLQPVVLDWFGQPGRGLGGFDSTVATDRGMNSYRIRIPSNSNHAHETPDGGQGMRGVGIPAAGTKAMSATWQESIPISEGSNRLAMVAGSVDLLEGSFTNSLPFDLLNPVLIYRGRAYSLPTRFRFGDQVSFTSSTVPKDVARRLQRRQNVGSEEKSLPWNPGDTSNLERLTELISFHRAAGGSGYTNLYNRYLSNLDYSEAIRLDRAVLFAEVSDPCLAWTLRRNNIPIQVAEGTRKTIVRILIPISKPTRANPAKNNSPATTSVP